MNRHQSGSPSAWKIRREAYQKTQGPVSNPGDGRLRKADRRLAARDEKRTPTPATGAALIAALLPPEVS